MEVVIGLLLYITPLVLVPFVLKSNSHLRRLAIVTCVTGSLIGEVTLIITSGRFEVSSISNPNFWSFLLLFYPLAVFPLGFWVALLAIAGYHLAKRISIHETVANVQDYVLSVVLGALIGVFFIVVYIGVAVFGGISHYPQEGMRAYLLAGLLTGGIIGPICVKFAASDEQ